MSQPKQTPAEQLYSALTLAKQEAQMANRPFGRMQVVEIIGGFLAEHGKGLAKERKKSGIDERAKAIFNLYPRREGGTAALLSISKAIEADGFELVLAKTTEYANAVARWPRLYRYSQTKPGEPSRDLVPMATTWFNQRRYQDDAANWVRVGGAPAPKPKQNIPEPPLWRERFPDYIHAHRSWESIDATSQAYIVSQMNLPPMERHA